MIHVKRNWDCLSEEKRRELITGLINFFKTERNEEIGVVAAGEILDLILEMSTSAIYNKGVEDSLIFIQERFENLKVDMVALLKKSA